MARKAVAYLRMSKDDLGTGLGIERQRDSVRSLAKAKGWRIDQEIVENDVSASNKKLRPGFERLLDLMASGEVEAVLAYAVDRLVRRLDDLTRLIDIAEEYAVPVATSAGELDLSTGHGRGLAKLLGVVASIEADTMGERLRRRKLQNAQAGSLRSGGMRPFGFTANRAETIPEEAAVLRAAAERVLAGSSLTSIANDLNRRGVKTSHGLSWTVPRLQDTLSRPSLCGRVVYRGELMRDEAGLPVKGEWQPILTEEQFDQLQVALAARRRSPSARWTSNRRHLLSGIARCGLCGSRLTGSKQTNGLLAYSCPVFRHLCRSKPHLDEYVVNAVKEKAASTSFDIEGWSDEEGQDVRRQIADLEQRKYEAAREFADGSVGADVLRAIVGTLEARISELRNSQVGRAAQTQAIEAVSFDLTRLEEMPLEEQHTAVSMFVERIIVHPVGRGRRFDPALVDIQWRDPDTFRWRGVVEA
jgi:site-specific DNA recombinase